MDGSGFDGCGERRKEPAAGSGAPTRGPTLPTRADRDPPKDGAPAKRRDRSARPPLYAIRDTRVAAAPAGLGTVYLVGAGPGSPDLLTLRAAALIGAADAVVYDRLVGAGIVAMARRDAQRIYVGKARSNHALPQDEISALLVRLAQEGKRVVRLKGGDPFIFGRGGEEIEVLAAHGIPFEVVPGVTAASGVAAYAGIPLTHRDHAHAVTFVTGHLQDGTMNLDWPALARPGQTVVVYMGLLGLPILCHELVAHGLAPTTPAAVVQQATTANQRVITGTLADLPGRAFDARLEPPTLIVVGDVVRLQRSFAWFDPSSLRGVAAEAGIALGAD
jgi:uroporphyrin-III C-methyltransferase/precorrin-2 dehydrogenase/sirohydrochlorin ferrochelatase